MILYGLLSTIIFFLLLPPYYVIRVITRKYLYGWREKLGAVETIDTGKPVIMFHGVSVGEVIALENLVKKTKETFPQASLVVTTGTKTGQEIAHKKYDEIVDLVTYFPFDIPFAVNSFLNKINPSVILIAETEIWPNFAYLANKKNIPLFIINGRISDSTFKLYRFLKPFFKQVLKYYTSILTQSAEDRDKLINIGAAPEKVEVMGNLKFDIARHVEAQPKHLNAAADCENFEILRFAQNDGNDYRIIIAGSTHKGEDEIILDAFNKLKTTHKDIKLLLAPRHLNRVQEVFNCSTIQPFNFSTGLRSNGMEFAKHDIIILDTLGELSKAYSICDFAFIGGSFNKTGGHNPLEAVIFNKPVVSGPSIHNFRDIYAILGRSSAGKVVKTPQELYEYMNKMLSDPEFYKTACEDCQTVFDAQRGALDYVLNKLSTLIK